MRSTFAIETGLHKIKYTTREHEFLIHLDNLRVEEIDHFLEADVILLGKGIDQEAKWFRNANLSEAELIV